MKELKLNIVDIGAFHSFLASPKSDELKKQFTFVGSSVNQLNVCLVYML